MKHDAVILLVYLMIGILTFGHAYNKIPDTEEGHFAGQVYTIHNGPGTKAAGSMLCAIGWPLYWSVKAFE